MDSEKIQLVESPAGEDADESTWQRKPCLRVMWDDKTKNVGIKFENTHFPNWLFVVGVLEMAKIEAEAQMKRAMAIHAQKQMMEQIEAEQVKQMLMGGK